MVDQTLFNWIQLIKKSQDYGVVLTPLAKFLAFYLRSFMNDEHDIAWPSIGRIMHETGMAKGTVKAKLQELSDAGFLIIRSRLKESQGGQQLGLEYLAVVPAKLASKVGQSLTLPAQKGGQLTCEGGSTTDLPFVKGGSIDEQKGGQPLTPNKQYRNKQLQDKALHFVLPPEIPKDLWNEFKDHRKKLRKPMTAYAEKLAAERAMKIASEEREAVTSVISRAIEKGWQTFYPDSDKARASEKAQGTSLFKGAV